MITRWLNSTPVDVPDSFSELNLPPIIAQALIQRGFSTPEAVQAFLEPFSHQESSPFDLPEMGAALERILFSIRNNEPICVWGDFDVDGQTSTALLVQTLRELGADVTYHIPIRAVSSHGVHIPELSDIIERGSKLILTCDTGISAHEAVAYASSHQVDFVITDHHEPIIYGKSNQDDEIHGLEKFNLPEATAVINPKTLPPGHPLETLAGVGVAYKLAQALIENTSSTDLRSHELLDLVALGLIADVALLTGDTRALVQKGIQILRDTNRPGLQIIMEMADVQPEAINEESIGFTFAPRLNAIGRLGDANPAVELLTTNDPVRARVLATQLEGLNSQRRLLTSQVYRAAEAQLREDPSLLEQPAILLENPSWPGGVIGIVASRLKERYNKPVILFNITEGEPARGSARSIEGVNITKAIAAQKDLLGHPMAAGLSLKQENLASFRDKLGKTIEQMIGDASYEEPALRIDAWLKLDELTSNLAEEIERLAPFGAGNPALTFASRNLNLKAIRKIGKNQDHLRLNLEDENGNISSILWWNGIEDELPESGSRIDIAYTLRASTYRGEKQLQLQYVNSRVVMEKPVEVKRSKIEVVDLRSTPERISGLTAQVLFEGEDREKGIGTDRYNLQVSEELAIYTTPPGPAELETILRKVKAKKVYLVAQSPRKEAADEFLTRLAGMVKFVIAKKGGRTNISLLAAATGQRESTVRIGLEWLAAGGHIVILGEEDAVTLSTGSGAKNEYIQKELYMAVNGLLEETAAYRSYVATTKDPESLFIS